MQKWAYCTLYQISQMNGWLKGVGMVYKGYFTGQGPVREELAHSHDALTKATAEPGPEG